MPSGLGSSHRRTRVTRRRNELESALAAFSAARPLLSAPLAFHPTATSLRRTSAGRALSARTVRRLEVGFVVPPILPLTLFSPRAVAVDAVKVRKA